jgi:predicted helicase
MELIKEYLEEIQKKYKTDHAREHAYRPALETLIEDINPNINAVNDPKQQKVGAPDFVLFKKKVSIGYIEAKDVDVDLDHEIKSKNQVNRYKASLNNFCFTNYLEFRFYLNGEEVEKVKIAELKEGKIEIDSEKFELLESLLKNFTTQKSISIRTPKELAKLMAEKAKMLKNVIYKSIKDKESIGEVEHQYEVFKQMLIHDLSEEQFADIYSQTVAYGMFAARYNDLTLENFTRSEANELLPKSNPFLRNFFQSIAGYDIDDRIVWIVDDLAELFNHVDVKELLANYGKETKRHDAVIHFYETFLGEFDAKMRKSRGVYYTPEPVVDFIVRAVDDILKDEFDIKDGLADTEKIDVLKEVPGRKNKKTVKEHRVQILDPATGTGTFLDRAIKHIFNSKFEGQEGLWQSYVDEHLLPRLHGFEILMASYAMAHLKLDITLSETGYDFEKGKGKRLGVYLTNSLEEPRESNRDLFSQWLSTESVEANKVKKEKPIMVVMGNPPYSGHSSNTGDYAKSLVDKYKVEPGGKEKLQERNPKWLNDDYVKFIAYGEELISENGEGILAFINNHGWLDNPTFRGMRWHLMQTFDEIYVINLHGNSKIKEIIPSGMVDENVFDIQQGVSINLFIKKRDKQKQIRINYKDIYGKRKEKYMTLMNKKLLDIKWKEISPRKPLLTIKDRDWEIYEEYLEGHNLSELFIDLSIGVQTHRDDLVIDSNRERILKKFREIYSNIDTQELLEKYSIRESKTWNLKKAKIEEPKFNGSNIKGIVYRPFDKRYIYFNKAFVDRTRDKVSRNLLRENLVLNIPKIVKVDWNHTLITKDVPTAISLDINGTYFTPLYLYNNPEGKLIREENCKPNLAKEQLDKIVKKLNLLFLLDHRHPDAGKKGTFNPLDVLDYIYAILHSPTYRERYKEFLKIDFPRIPFTSDRKLFWKLVEKGRELRKYHLMEHEKSNKLITKFPVSGSNEVSNRLTKTDPGFKLTDKKKKIGRVWINEEQYFDNVPELTWNFYIGGYQPAQKWLKDRRDRKLSYDEIEHYQKIIVALVNTDRIMKEIDEIVEEWPIK